MAKFTAQELAGQKVYLSLGDRAFKSLIFLVKDGKLHEQIDNLRGVDVHIDLKENRTRISATLNVVEDDYDNPVKVLCPVEQVDALASIDVVETKQHNRAMCRCLACAAYRANFTRNA